MGVGAAHTPELEEANSQDNLPLGRLRDAVPERLRRHTGELVTRHLPRELDVVRVHDVANKASHRHTAVLDLRLAQEADRRRVRVAPELATREVQWIPIAQHRVQLRSQAMHVRALNRDSNAVGRTGSEQWPESAVPLKSAL